MPTESDRIPQDSPQGGQDSGQRRTVGGAARRGRRAITQAQRAAVEFGGALSEALRKTLHDPRDHVVMVRVNKEALEKLDELVECGLLSSRSTAAAYLITEGIEARTDLYNKIAEQAQVIRDARARLQRLLEDDA